MPSPFLGNAFSWAKRVPLKIKSATNTNSTSVIFFVNMFSGYNAVKIGKAAK